MTSVVGELQAQRDALLAGTWVTGIPLHEGEACLALAYDASACPHGIIPYTKLSDEALMFVIEAAKVGTLDRWRKVMLETYVEQQQLLPAAYFINYGFQSAGDAIAVIEEALRLAKEPEA